LHDSASLGDQLHVRMEPGIEGRDLPRSLSLLVLHVRVPSGHPGLYLDFGSRRKVDVIVALDPMTSFDLDQWRR